MRAVVLDPRMGASGDMLLGSLIDAGADPEVLDPVEAALGVDYAIAETVEQGIAALDVIVDHPGGNHHHGEGAGPHRTLAEVLEIIDSIPLDPSIRTDAEAAFQLLATAEAAVHGTSIEDTHFHEVGADDAIADVLGTLLVLADLDPDRVLTTAAATGSGEVETSHGIYPIPPPAVAEIGSRSGLRFVGGPVEAELLTPTGATLLASVADHVDTVPPMTIDAIGYGTGTRSFDERPNTLRALVGTIDGNLTRESIAVLETNVDDTSPEVIGHLQRRLRQAGAFDVAVVPLTMKKSRPGHLIRVITSPTDEERIARLLAEETGTLGIRSVAAAHRWVTDRDVTTVEIDVEGNMHPVDVKIGLDTAGAVIDVSAEYEDAATIAQASAVPVREVMRRAETAAWAGLEREEE